MSLDDINKLANDIHFNSIVLDCHNDTMLKVVDEKTGEPIVDMGEETDMHIDLSKAREGGLDVGYFAAFTSLMETEDMANNNILALINALYWNKDRNREAMDIARSVDEIKNIVGLKKLAAVPTIEGAYSLTEKNAIELLNQYYDMGVRVVAYVWNQENNLGAGTEGPNDMGLTELGIEVTREMNRLGMIIDVSHMNEKTFWDSIKYSKAPIMATHSCSSSLTAHVRNLTDEQMIALKENGGLVNINYWWELLGKPKASVNVERLVDHIDYVVDLIGIDHVGLGSDFDGATMPVGIDTVVDIPKITLEMLKRDYSRQDIEKVLGLNNLRMMDTVQGLSSNNIDNNMEINPSFKMGDSIENINTLNARMEDGNIDSSRIIIDGIVYNSKYEEGVLFLDDNIDLYRGYHTVTFELIRDGKKTRNTSIFKYNK